MDGGGSDVFGRLTLKSYGKDVRQRYLAFGGVSNVPQSRVTSADTSQKISQANTRLGEFSTRHIPGTVNGTAASMAAVNFVLKEAGYQPLADGTLSVAAGEQALKEGRGSLVHSAEARAGDLVFFDAGGWQQIVGICATNGCSLLNMNSPQEGKFALIKDSKFREQGSPFELVNPRIYRLDTLSERI
ncbi:MAG: hypothetical protein NVS2B14_15670 [Chamaesiphon sp.]